MKKPIEFSSELVATLYGDTDIAVVLEELRLAGFRAVSIDQTTVVRVAVVDPADCYALITIFGDLPNSGYSLRVRHLAR